MTKSVKFLSIHYKVMFFSQRNTRLEDKVILFYLKRKTA